MSSPPSSTEERLITGEELARMGDIGRCELIDGRIIRMGPTNRRQGRVEFRIAAAIDAFVRPRRLGTVHTGEVGLYTRRRPDRVRGADVLFLTHETEKRCSPELAFFDVAPDLVVEVLSPDDRAVDQNQKLREYFEIGVRLVWVADPEVRVVSAYRSLTDIREFDASATLPGDHVLPGFGVAVGTLFEE